MVYAGGDVSTQADGLRTGFKNRFPGIDLTVAVDYSKYHDVRGDNQFATDTLAPDVVQLQTVRDFVRWKEQGRLLPYKPAGFSKLYAPFRDPHGARLTRSHHRRGEVPHGCPDRESPSPAEAVGRAGANARRLYDLTVIDLADPAMQPTVAIHHHRQNHRTSELAHHRYHSRTPTRRTTRPPPTSGSTDGRRPGSFRRIPGFRHARQHRWARISFTEAQ